MVQPDAGLAGHKAAVAAGNGAKRLRFVLEEEEETMKVPGGQQSIIPG
jgi:hypothetical protein